MNTTACSYMGMNGRSSKIFGTSVLQMLSDNVVLGQHDSSVTVVC